MTQVIPFDQSKGGNEPLRCLRNTRLGFGIPEYFPTAWQAWLYTEQHTEFIPLKLDVPLFFSFWATIAGKYANYGHVGVRLADGRFWSDGKVYDSLATFERLNPKVHYVGWGESINDVKVIKGEDEPMYPTEEACQLLTAQTGWQKDPKTGKTTKAAIAYWCTGTDNKAWGNPSLVAANWAIEVFYTGRAEGQSMVNKYEPYSGKKLFVEKTK